MNPMGIRERNLHHRLDGAVANAVMDTLAPLGIRHVDMRFTPARIWSAIQAKH